MIYTYIHIYSWLVVYIPLWRIWFRQFRWFFHSQYMERWNSCSSHHIKPPRSAGMFGSNSTPCFSPYVFSMEKPSWTEMSWAHLPAHNRNSWMLWWWFWLFLGVGIPPTSYMFICIYIYVSLSTIMDHRLTIPLEFIRLASGCSKICGILWP